MSDWSVKAGWLAGWLESEEEDTRAWINIWGQPSTKLGCRQACAPSSSTSRAAAELQCSSAEANSRLKRALQVAAASKLKLCYRFTAIQIEIMSLPAVPSPGLRRPQTAMR